MNQVIKIGTKFLTGKGKTETIATVVDIHTTTNNRDVIVHVRYVATHEFCGQVITQRDILKTTILKNLIAL